jgi:hypothetical protein
MDLKATFARLQSKLEAIVMTAIVCWSVLVILDCTLAPEVLKQSVTKPLIELSIAWFAVMLGWLYTRPPRSCEQG